MPLHSLQTKIRADTFQRVVHTPKQYIDLRMGVEMEAGTAYAKNSIPNYDCPLCKTGKIEPILDSMTCRQTGETIAARESEEWVDIYQEILRVDTVCTNDNCGEVGVLIMKGDVWPPTEEQLDYEVYFRPVYIDPPPELISIPDNCPVQVKQLLQKAFYLYWVDPASCGNKIRIAVEEMLSALNVERYMKNKNGIDDLNGKGRPKSLSLNERLKIFKRKSSKCGECFVSLDSIKWLGNESSHAGEMPVDGANVGRAITIFGSVLNCLYSDIPIPTENIDKVNHLDFWYHPVRQASWPKRS